MMLRTLSALVLGAALLCPPAGARQASVPAAPLPAPLVSAADPAAAPAAASAAATPPAAPVLPAAPATPRAQLRPDLAPVQPIAAASAGSLLQTIFGLTVVLGLLAVFAWGMKRFGPRQAAGAAGLRIVGALNLGGRERLMVVEVGDQWIVVGASPGRVNALATMPKQTGADAAATLHPHETAAPSFGEWLKQTIEKRNAK